MILHLIVLLLISTTHIFCHFLTHSIACMTPDSYVLLWTILKNVREHCPSIFHTFRHPSMIFHSFPAFFAFYLIVVDLTLFQQTSYPFRTVLYTYQTCLCSFLMFSKIFPFTVCAILSLCTVIYVLFIMGLHIVVDMSGLPVGTNYFLQ